jgi:hypothetical protein
MKRDDRKRPSKAAGLAIALMLVYFAGFRAWVSIVIGNKGELTPSQRLTQGVGSIAVFAAAWIFYAWVYRVKAE